MKIENATEKDTLQIVELDREAFGNGAITELTANSQLQTFPEGMLTAKENGQVVGVVFCERHSKEKFPFYNHNVLENHNPDGSLLYLSVITVAKKFRNRGIGSKLLDGVGNLAKELEIKKIYCPVNKKHPYLDKGVLHFWQKNGYEITGEISWQFASNRSLEAFNFEKKL